MKATLQSASSGTIMITPENDDDIWTLSTLIHEGDVVKARTMRKVKIGDASTDRSVKVVRKPMNLTINTEKVEFTGQQLRVLGTIEEGPEDISKGEHHALVIEAQITVHVTKQRWPQYLLDKLKDAVNRKSEPVLLCVFDREQANFGLATGVGYKFLSGITGNMPKKVDAKQVSTNFYKEIAQQIKEYQTSHKASIVVIGAAMFWHQYLKEELKDAEIKQIYCAVNDSSQKGLDEVVRKTELKQALKEARFSDELNEVDKLLSAIAQEKPIVYSLQDCRRAADAGAISELLVAEEYITKLRLDDNVQELEQLLDAVDQSGGKVMLIGNHDGGKKIEGLGGVAALLRFALE